MTIPEQNPPSAPEPYRPTLLIFLLMPIAAAIVAYFLSGSITAGNAPDSKPPVVALTPYTLIGSFAPDFTLPTPDGKTITLADLRGKWVVLNFWATWCPPCKAEMPVFQALYSGEIKYAEKLGEVTMIAVSFQDSAAQVNAFTAEYGLTLPMALDENGAISKRYGVVQLPVTYFIDPNGVVRYKHIGELNTDLLQRTLEKAANES